MSPTILPSASTVPEILNKPAGNIDHAAIIGRGSGDRAADHIQLSAVNKSVAADCAAVVDRSAVDIGIRYD